MFTDIVPSFVIRALGPFFFVGGITCFLLMNHYQERQLQLAKAMYVTDDVYSQKNSDEEYSDTISSAELIGTLLANPTVKLKIRNNNGGRTITIVPASNGAMYVTVEEGLGSLSKTVYAKTLFNFQGFNMNYVEAGDYSTKFEYDADGSIECITYTLTKE